MKRPLERTGSDNSDRPQVGVLLFFSGLNLGQVNALSLAKRSPSKMSWTKTVMQNWMVLP